MSKLYILSFTLTSHADILTRNELEFVKSFIEDYCKGNSPIYTKSAIIYTVDAESLSGLHMMAIESYCARHEIDHTLKVVTI